LFSQALARAQFTPDGRLAVTAMAGGIVKMWNPATAEQEGKGTTHGAPLTALAFSPDNKRMLTADQKGVVFIAEVGTGEAVGQLPDHPGAVTYAAFSPDGQRVATCCADRTVRVWDVAKATPLTPPIAHPATALAAFSHDGRWLATAAGNRLRLWDAATGEPASPPLPHAPESSPITYLAVAPDGKVVTGTGAADDPRGRRTWDLLPDARPVADIQEMVKLLTGHRLEGQAAVVVAAADAKKSWDDLRPRYPADFSPDAGRALAWARRALDECEREQNWVGAVRHLDRLIAAEPARVDLYLRRASAHRAMKQLDGAVADYSAAIAQAKDRTDLRLLRAAAFAEQRQWEKAADDYGQVIALRPDDLNALFNRGKAYAELGRWDKAAADFGRVNSRGGEEVGVFRDQALAALGAGDKAAYKQACERMSRRFGTKTAAGPVVGWTCALGDGALPDLKPLLTRAEQAQKDNPKSAAHLVTYAALLYRTGQFAAALPQLEKAQAMRGSTDLPTDWLLLAMTQQRLGKPDEAKKWLDKVAAANGKTWQERLEVDLLRKEAEALVKAPKP
jgi:WD40 repeat protein